MTEAEYIKLKAQIAILKEIQQYYAGKTIDNIIQQMEAKMNEVNRSIFGYKGFECARFGDVFLLTNGKRAVFVKSRIASVSIIVDGFELAATPDGEVGNGVIVQSYIKNLFDCNDADIKYKCGINTFKNAEFMDVYAMRNDQCKAFYVRKDENGRHILCVDGYFYEYLNDGSTHSRRSIPLKNESKKDKL